MSRISAVLDSCVLYPFYVRDTLLCAAEEGLYRPIWSEKIFSDATSNLVKDGRMSLEKATSFENKIKKAFPEAMVSPPDELAQIMTNSLEDRHVMACAVFGEAEIIVTDNLKDFQPKDIDIWHKKAMSADNFLTYLYELFPDRMIKVVHRQAKAKTKPPTTISELLDILDRSTSNFANNIRYHEKKWELAKVIQKVVHIFGRESSNGKKYLEGNQYCIWIDKQSVGITSKSCGRDILRICGKQANSYLALKDMIIFEKFMKEVESSECKVER